MEYIAENKYKNMKQAVKDIPRIALSKCMSHARTVFWYRKTMNFGDLLMPELMRHYGYIPFHCSGKRAEIAGIGSIVQLLPEHYSGIVLGSGLIMDKKLRLPHARILAVRGPLTKQRIGAPPDVVLGDPGVLANRLISRRSEKIYKLGVIPHYMDKNNPIIMELKAKNPHDVTIIDVQQKPRQVIAEIDQCERIISSSLHGLIVADSLGIPANWTQLSDRIVGGGFKFYDYNLAVLADGKPVVFSTKLEELIGSVRIPRANLNELVRELEFLFNAL